MSKKYPEVIYKEFPTCGSEQGNIAAHAAGRQHAYDLGYEHGKQAEGDLTGWSNLTEAIKAGEPIDWDTLDGAEAKCVHPEQGTLTHKLEREDAYSPEDCFGWYKEGDPVWVKALYCSWLGHLGWSLYIKGDLPLRKRTADQLEPGTCFKGKCMGEVRDCLMYQEAPAYYEVDDEEVGPVAELKAVGVNLYHRESREGASTSPVNWLASQVEVLDVYGIGTFQKQKDQA